MIEEKKQEMANRPNPYQKEIDTCDHLIAIFQKLRVQYGQVEESEPTIQQVEKQMLNQFAKEDLSKKVNDGKLEKAKSKAEKEQELMIQIGGGKKKKHHQKKQKDVVVEDVFTLDFAVINKLGQLKISPPLGPDDLEAKQKELGELMVKYDKEGEQRLKEEEENIEDYDPEAERRKQGGDRGKRGYNRRGQSNDEEQDEFAKEEAKDEEKKRGNQRRGNKKENLKVDENNYPEL